MCVLQDFCAKSCFVFLLPSTWYLRKWPNAYFWNAKSKPMVVGLVAHMKCIRAGGSALIAVSPPGICSLQMAIL